MTAATRELARSSRQGKLGDRAMVRMRAQQVTLYRVEWEYDGHQADFDEGGFAGTEPVRRLRVKAFRSKGAAYNWMALRLIFAKRNGLATSIGSNGYPEGCRLCDAETKRTGAPDEGPELCRYHDHGGEYFEWLKWRDSRSEQP